jgi:NAD(P)-dependent dehydrogenase (short-subunit alcohol dehydrogenase family)
LRPLDRCRSQGGRAAAVQHDVGVESQWKDAIAAVLNTFGRLDVLVNNAGRALLRPLTGHSVEDFDSLLSANLKGVFIGSREAIAVLRKQGGGGSIINISSVAGIVGVNSMSIYSATKGAIRLFTKSLALETAADNIRCNSVHPGMIDTDFFHTTALGDPEASKAISSAIPMGRLGVPDDVANCVAFLASTEASYITGAEFIVDGGYSAQ